LQIGGDIQIGGVILLHMMSKGEKQKDLKRNSQVLEEREALFIKGITSGGVTFFYQKRRDA
jgi:hypothetical protein